MSAMRGLTMFISDIRTAKTKDEELKRVEKELAHIRAQFASKSIDGYGLKKYVWKLLYMYMLGYDIEIGHMEALKLITSPKYTEKNAGYMACSLLWNENNEFLRLIIQSVKKDLQPSIDDVNQCMALAFIANVGGQEMAESLASDVQKLLISGKSRSFVRKKSALCLLRLFRRYPDCIPQDGFPSQVIALLDDPNIGVVTSVMSLLLGLASHNPAGYGEAPAKAVHLLAKLAFSKERKSVYRYYLTLCPWLQVKLLRLLQYFPPPADKNVMARLNHVLTDILNKTAITKNVNKNNADHSILFEAINVIIHQCIHGVKELQGNAIALLGRFISIREANFRYLGLETMARLAHIPGSLPAIKKHQDVIQASLQDPDVSIRKRGLDLLYVMCDKSNAKDIVNALVTYVQTAPIEMREELVLKIAILSEKFATDLRWYVDIVLQLISYAGDFVTEDIWYRVVQIVTNNEDLQDYAASTCYKFLTNPAVHENGVKVGSYILGEFGDQIKDTALTGPALFEVLEKKFATSSITTKALILSAYIKMANTYPELKQRVSAVFEAHRSYVDTEVQQRACEYFIMNQYQDTKLMESVFDVMPNYSERESLLLKRIKKAHKQTTDRDVWTEPNAAEKKTETKEEESDEDDDDDEDEDDDDEEEEEEESEEESDDDDEEGDEKSNGHSNTNGKKEKPAIVAKGGVMDLLGGFDLGLSDATGAHSTLFPPQPQSQVINMLGSDSGVVYETRDLQIGCKMSVENNNSVKLVFYYGNRCPNALKDVTAELPDNDAYKIQARPNEPFEVAPKKQVLHYFLLHCFKPFKFPISVKIKFNYLGKAHFIDVTLPIALSTFIVPTPVDASQFVGAWTKYGNEIVVMRKLEGVTVGSLQQTISQKLRLAIIPSVEKTSDNFVASGIFHTATKNAHGQNVTMPCLLRIETKPQIPQFRVTVHTGHQSVSEALIHAITVITGAQEA